MFSWTLICLLVSGTCALAVIPLAASAPTSTASLPSASYAALASRKGHHSLLRRLPKSVPLAASSMNITSMIKQSNGSALLDEPVISTTFVALLLEHIKESTLIPFQAAARVPRSSNGKRQKYCGSVLKDVLRLLCDGKYYSGQNGTRSRASSLLTSQTNLATGETIPVGDAVGVPSPREVISSVIHSPEHSSAGQSTHSSQKSRKSRPVRGVVDECCRKSCTVTDLRMYCMID